MDDQPVINLKRAGFKSSFLGQIQCRCYNKSYKQYHPDYLTINRDTFLFRYFLHGLTFWLLDENIKAPNYDWSKTLRLSGIYKQDRVERELYSIGKKQCGQQNSQDNENYQSILKIFLGG